MIVSGWMCLVSVHQCASIHVMGDERHMYQLRVGLVVHESYAYFRYKWLKKRRFERSTSGI